ncbi:MAG TPA: PPC domain-containing protein [Verrucomicrobiae bacterium]|nr:PPC domain-containing protein [Verrucomicrobiae bacterium]
MPGIFGRFPRFRRRCGQDGCGPASPIGTLFYWAAFVLAFEFAILSANAQPVPKTTSVSPEWVQRGKTSIVALEGENLSNVTGFVFSGDGGLTATNAPAPVYPASIESSRGGIVPADGDEKKMRVSVMVAGDAPLGPRELRIVTPEGVSNPLTVNVGFLPELAEAPPNNAANQAQAVELPAAINGVIREAAESDFYRFKARKGERLIFDLLAFRAGSPLDSSLTLIDASGKELARSEDANGLDSLIDFSVPEDGEYLLSVRDFRYQGGKDFKYRIAAGELPYLDSVFPLGGQRGKAVEVALSGRSLDGLEKMKLRIEPSAPLGQQEIRANTAKGFSNPILFDVSDVTEFTESEPNNGSTNANTVNAPVTINGRISGDKDVDQFKFKAEKGQQLMLEVVASRFGSPLDVLMTLTDATGKTIQENDDAAGADARIERNFGEAGDYIVKVRDLLGRNGEDFGYRLSIRPVRSDFRVTFAPDVPRISRGGGAVITVDVQRRGGFGGPVEARLENLPRGVSAQSLLVPPDNAVSPMIVLHASEDASLDVHKIRLVANGVINGQTVTREGKPQSNGRAVREAFLTVLDSPPFTLEPITLSARTEQNQSAAVEVAVRRRNGFLGEIKVIAEGFSAGKEPLTKNVDVEAVTLKAPDSRATLNLKAKQDAETGERMIVFKGEAKVEGQGVTQYSRAIPLAIDPFPFTLSSSLPRLALTALSPESKSAASEAEFSIKANRRGWFTEDINLSVEGLPEGISINSTNLARGVGEAGFKILASDKAPAGKEISLTVVGTANVNGRAYQFRAPAIKVTINAPEPAAQVAASAEGEN